MKIAILGAPGCVGRNLIKKLLESPGYEIIASYREKQDAESLKHDRLFWRQVDLHDISSAENFLQGADVLIYLIHSLGAKDFEFLDVQFANTAGHAAQHVGIKKIIFLGGIVPSGKRVSPHLTSRMKTGQALASYEIPVGEVRASILLETCSMSYLIVYYLAKRLPIIITPGPFFTIRMSSQLIELLTGVPKSLGLVPAEGLRNNTVPSHNRFREIP